VRRFTLRGGCDDCVDCATGATDTATATATATGAGAST